MRTIFCRGQVYTGLLPLCTAFAVEDGKFIFAGGDEAALALARPGDGVVDLKGRFVCAGFNDSHMHLVSLGLALRRARLNEHTDSLRGLIGYFRDFAKDGPNERGWIVGRGWNQDYFADVKRMPDRRDLDEVSRDYPVAAVRCCGHCAVVNSKALELLGVTAATPAPEGGAIGMENGEPDGRFYDAAMDMIWDAVPDVGKEDVKDMIRAACRRYSACGVTSCQTDDYATSWRMVNEAYHELAAAGELTVRVTEQCNFHDAESLAAFIAEGNVTLLLLAFRGGQCVEDVNTSIGGVFTRLKGGNLAAFQFLDKLREDGLVIDESFCGLALITGNDCVEDALCGLLRGLVLQLFEAIA